MQQLEQRKLRRNWTGINWIGESSSLTGTDAIAWQRLGAEDRNDQHINYSREDREIQAFYQDLALDWLTSLPEQWQQHQQDITLSVGFVWVAGSVPQRDVLQHCREAEKQAKRLGRNRVTIRVVFNSGQYVQWTCPWHYLEILKHYRNRDNKTYSNWQQSGQQSEQQPNWNHVYNDLLQLKSRHAFGLCVRDQQVSGQEIMENCQAVLEFFDIYFPGQKERIEQNNKKEQDKTKKIKENSKLYQDSTVSFQNLTYRYKPKNP
ncbi:hypothetical protein [Coleofasciculus sp. F4-SAH-05]|uniref:hypothetical protein n=1 Tax=Coleofasciculus sp. F4-SAH-05 TaxID=3069525 RepID=UPI0032F1926E